MAARRMELAVVSRIEVQFECDSCDRIEWCQIVNENCDELGWVPRLDEVPEGWLVELGESGQGHIVQCPDHRRLI